MSWPLEEMDNLSGQVVGLSSWPLEEEDNISGKVEQLIKEHSS